LFFTFFFISYASFQRRVLDFLERYFYISPSEKWKENRVLECWS